MLLTKTSSGGSDLLALMLSRGTPINVGVFIFMIDSIVITFGWIVIHETTLIYSGLMVGMIGLTTSFITSTFSS